MMGIGLGMLGTLTPMITGKVFDTAIPQAERGMLIQFAAGLLHGGDHVRRRSRSRRRSP